MAESAGSLGKKIDKLHALRDKITAENKKVDALKQQKNELEAEIINDMKAHGDLEQASSSKATATRTIQPVPHVTDWERFYRYILKNRALHLLERRPAGAAYRELMEQRKGRAVPGVETFNKETLSLRKRG